MAQTLTLLNFINNAMKRVSLIKGDAGEITGLTDSPRQTEIDILVQATNEVISDMYSYGELPEKAAEGTLTLVTDTREYDTPTDFEGMITEILVNETDGYRIWPYAKRKHKTAYLAMRAEQLQPSNYTGRPNFYAINPENGKFRLNNAPTSAENGEAYRYTYRKDLTMSVAGDTFVFSDAAVNKLMPAVKEIWNRESIEKFDADIYWNALSGAIELARPTPQRARY